MPAQEHAVMEPINESVETENENHSPPDKDPPASSINNNKKWQGQSPLPTRKETWLECVSASNHVFYYGGEKGKENTWKSVWIRPLSDYVRSLPPLYLIYIYIYHN